MNNIANTILAFVRRSLPTVITWIVIILIVAGIASRNLAGAAALRIVTAGKVPKDVVFQSLFALHKDSDTTVQQNAVDGLAEFGKQNDTNLAALTDKMKDGDPDIRTAASAALSKIGG